MQPKILLRRRNQNRPRRSFLTESSEEEEQKESESIESVYSSDSYETSEEEEQEEGTRIPYTEWTQNEALTQVDKFEADYGGTYITSALEDAQIMDSGDA